jgi:hypothetical protein
MIFIISFFLNGIFARAEEVAKPGPVIRSISIFKNEIQLDVEKNQVKSGTKILAKTAVNHKCLLVVKKVIKDLAYADATQCPGYATLRKGQTVTITPDSEINEEIKAAPILDNQKG